MSTATPTKTARTIITVGTSNSSVQRGTLDLRTAFGGLLTVKLTNSSTGPTIAPQARILVAHDAGTTPAAGAAGSVWKTLWQFSGDLVGNSVTEQSIRIDDSVMHIEVEVLASSGTSGFCEALLSELTSINNV